MINTGIEVETELGNRIPWSPDALDAHTAGTNWHWCRDLSLRDKGVEFKLRMPLHSWGLENALQEFPEILARLGIKPADLPAIVSDRAGIHIHLDVRPLTPTGTLNVLLGFILFERVLFMLAGDCRRFSPFTQAVSGTALHTRAVCSHPDYLQQGVKRRLPWELPLIWPRYSSINYQAVSMFGSLEIRLIPTHLYDGYLRSWIKLCHNIYEFGLWGKFVSPKDVDNLMALAYSPDELVYTLCGDDIPCRKMLTGLRPAYDTQQAFLHGVHDLASILLENPNDVNQEE